MLSADIGSNLAMKIGSMQTLLMATNQIIYRGGLVAVRLTDGLAYPAVDDVNDTYKQIIMGVAWEHKDSEDSTTMTVRARLEGKYLLKFPGCDQSCIGRLALLKDDETVQTYSSNQTKVVVGRIFEFGVEGESVYVNLLDRPSRIASSLYE